MKWPAFIGGSFQPQSGTADNSRTVNWYVEPSQGQGATTEACLYPVPGVNQIQEPAVLGFGSAPTYGLPRAHLFHDGREFAILDDTLYEISQDGTLTDRGNVGDDRLPATISTNGDVGGQLFITSNRNGFYYTLSTNTLTQIATLNGLAFQSDFLDGYFLLLDDQTSTLYISALADGSSWTLTDSAQRSLAGDPWIAMKVCGRFIWLFGELTTEVWYNTADTFPFSPHPSGLLNFGIKAPWSPAIIGSDIHWICATRTGRLSVVRSSGFTPQIISTFALDKALGEYLRPDEAYADVYSDAGHTFYLLGFDTDAITWAFDAVTNTWAERMSWNTATATEEAYRLRFYARAFDEHRFLDIINGARYELNATYTQDVSSRVIRRIRRCPAPFNENKRVRFSDFELDLEPGLGLTTGGHITSPQVMLRLSNDGGKTWPVERWQASGKIGEYLTRLSWSRLGTARRRVFEVSVTDKAQWRLSGAYLEAKSG